MKSLLLAIALAFCVPIPSVFIAKPEPMKIIALTFDDEIQKDIFFGNDGLSEILHRNNAPATFFVLGYQVKSSPDIFRSLAENGHEIENHTWGHDNLLELEKKSGLDGVLRNIDRTSDEVKKITGKKTCYLRPPYWAMNRSLREKIIAHGYRVMMIDNPDVNSEDYDDAAHHRPADVLYDKVKRMIGQREHRGIYSHVLVFHEERQTLETLRKLIPELIGEGYRFVTLEEYSRETSETRYAASVVFAAEQHFYGESGLAKSKEGIRAMYLSVDDLSSKKKIMAIDRILEATDANALVIDFKVDREAPADRMRVLVEHYKEKGIYLIARIVVMQDSYLAKRRPELALRRRDGVLWHSGRDFWHRYWVDPASPEVLSYNISIAEHAIDMGFDEVNFDYVRFPTDGSMSNLLYPFFKPDKMTKVDVMNKFFEGIASSLRAYSPKTILSVDVFGEVVAYGGIKEIGQEFAAVVKYFDVVCPMAYPSHYRCGEFKLADPNANPYVAYKSTLKLSAKILEGAQSKKIRPWIQAFSIRNIYGCGPVVHYTPAMIREEIRGGNELGIGSFMLWNASSDYNPEVFNKK